MRLLGIGDTTAMRYIAAAHPERTAKLPRGPSRESPAQAESPRQTVSDPAAESQSVIQGIFGIVLGLGHHSAADKSHA